MEENLELEEGEAWYYKDDNEDGNKDKSKSKRKNNIDPDVALSYIDEKIQNVLGHFQKDFEGGVSAENLGAKFGGYGSFLPACVRSPAIWSRPKTPQRSPCKPRSPNNLPLEGISHCLTIPSNAPSSVRLGTASRGAKEPHNSAVASRDVSVKLGPGLSSLPVAPKSTLKHENVKKSGNLSEHRALKVRIKVGFDNRAPKNNEIYSGLGLDNSPSSSLGNSPEASGCVPHVSQEIAGDSPTSILQVMTSFPLPGCALISPLHDSLLCLMRKEELFRESRPVPIKCNGEHSSLLADEPASVLDKKKLSKEEPEFLGTSIRAAEKKHGNGITSENGTAFSVEKKIEINNAEGNGVKDRRICGDSVKEGYLESMLGQNNGNERRNSRSSPVEKVLEHRAVNCYRDAHVGLRSSGKCKTNKSSASSKADSDASKCKGDFDAGSVEPSKQMIGRQALAHVEGETAMPSRKERRSLESKKKPQGFEQKNAADVSTKESLKVGVNAASKETTNARCGVSKAKDKMHKLNVLKDSSNVRDNHRDALGAKPDQLASAERLSDDTAKDSWLDDFPREQCLSSNESKGKFSGKSVGKRAISRAVKDAVDKDPVRDAAYSCPPTAEFAVFPEVVLPAATQDNWVCCDSCQKWRLLFCCEKPEELPDKWLCSMLHWLPGMNRCEISEEATTNATIMLNQQHSLENHGNRIPSVASSVHVQHVEQNHQNLDSHAPFSSGKKKHSLKETTKADSSHVLTQTPNTKNHLQEYLRSRSLNDLNRTLAEPHLVTTSRLDHSSKSHNLVVEKKIAKQEEDHMNGGGKLQRKKKNMREADDCGYGNSKKSKTKDFNYVNRHQDFDMEPGMVDPITEFSLAVKGSGKIMQKSGKHSEDRNCYTKERLLVSMKRLGDQAQVSSDGECLDKRTVGRGNDSVKKRRLLDFQDNQNGHNSDIHVVESSKSALRKAKKSRLSKSVAKDSGTRSATNNRSQNGKVDQIFSSGHKDHQADLLEGGRTVDQDKQPVKHRRKFAYRQALDGMDSIRKDFGSGQVAVTGTSNSSKASSSLKSRAILDDMKGSPVESVSSSPLRTQIPERLTSSARVANGNLRVVSKLSRRWDAEDGGEVNLSMTEPKENDSGSSYPEPFYHLDQVANHRSSGKNRAPDFLIGDPEITEHHKCSSDLLVPKNCHAMDSVDKTHIENVTLPQKSGRTKDKNRSSSSDLDKGNVKVYNPVNEQESMCLVKSIRSELEIDPKSHAPFCKKMNHIKHNLPDRPSVKSTKDEKVHARRTDAGGQCLKDRKMENELNLVECDGSDTKVDALCGKNWNAVSQQRPIQDFEGETKMDPIQKELRSGTPKLFSHYECEVKQEGQGRASLRGKSCDRVPIHVSGKGDVTKVLKHLGNDGTKNSACQSLGNCVPDLREVTDVNALSPGNMTCPRQTAFSALKEAKELRDYADRLKSSGFGFESNEAYFQAALKFLVGASLLESCDSEGGKQGEVNPVEAYGTTVKLCNSCALEYESRHEMAAAALAFKCMEVASWRVVYGKTSLSMRNHSDLQASLHMVPQGESPSSSASDIDNFNNQATVDKAALSKGTISHVAGNPVFFARNHSNVVQLLDFTQNVNFALEASRKSQDAFLAANIALEEAQIRESIATVKKAIDFSFHDVEGFIRLVRLAMEAISCSGFAGAKD